MLELNKYMPKGDYLFFDGPPFFNSVNHSDDPVTCTIVSYPNASKLGIPNQKKMAIVRALEKNIHKPKYDSLSFIWFLYIFVFANFWFYVAPSSGGGGRKGQRFSGKKGFCEMFIFFTVNE